MNKIENPELSRKILNHLTELYSINRKREGIHLSTLVYCLTRSFFDTVAPIEATDEEVMLFSLGLGLQDVLTPSEAEVPVYEQDGVFFSPDFLLRIRTERDKTKLSTTSGNLPEWQPDIEYDYVELKTTRMSSNKEELPETWLEYIMGGCYIRKVNTYNLSVLHMLGNYRPPFPELKSYILEFTDDELETNWHYLMARKRVLQDSLLNNTPPAPKVWCKDWECKNCRYALQCSAIEMGGEKEE